MQMVPCIMNELFTASRDEKERLTQALLKMKKSILRSLKRRNTGNNQKRGGDKTSHISFFSIRNKKPEPRHRAFPVFLMLIGEEVFTRMSPPLFAIYIVTVYIVV